MASPTVTPEPIDWIDLEALARHGDALAGAYALDHLPRVLLDAPALAGREHALVQWRVHAEWRDPPAAVAAAWRALGGTRAAVPRQLWLRVQAHGALPLVCQRCLEPYWEPVQLDRWFRFVADEATALAEDDTCEEDLLVRQGPRFDLRTLVEDELLLAAPLVPRHGACPHPLPLAHGDRLHTDGPAADDDGAPPAAPRRPLAALAALKRPVR